MKRAALAMTAFVGVIVIVSALADACYGGAIVAGRLIHRRRGQPPYACVRWRS